MKIYNTLTRKKEEFKPIVEGEARIYACGPTVYNYIHIGNARPACIFDTLRRYMESIGYKVTFVQNFTDVDDKIIKKANEEGVESSVISERFIEEYKADAKGLNIREATHHPKVTTSMDLIIDMISSLVEKGYAYELNGDVYFSVKDFSSYGKLSGMPLDELEAGARIDVDTGKKNPMDFALWKSAKPGEPFWSSPWGEGRPGWHIECSAMSKKFLGASIDIHCGGQDLIFPHHENEIAQSECANGVNYANYWMHNGYINIDNRKMSKSLGNFFTVRDVANEYGYEPIRFMMISAHYRSPINYSKDIIKSAISSLERLYTCRDNIDFLKDALKDAEASSEFISVCDEKRRKFNEAMDDDLNTADALSSLFELVKEINTYLNSGNASKKDAEYASEKFDEMADILGILYNRKNDIPEDIKKMAEERAEARKNKNWALADELRNKIAEAGFTVEDTPSGPKLVRI